VAAVTVLLTPSMVALHAMVLAGSVDGEPLGSVAAIMGKPVVMAAFRAPRAAKATSGVGPVISSVGGTSPSAAGEGQQKGRGVQRREGAAAATVGLPLLPLALDAPACQNTRPCCPQARTLSCPSRAPPLALTGALAVPELIARAAADNDAEHRRRAGVESAVGRDTRHRRGAHGEGRHSRGHINRSGLPREVCRACHGDAGRAEVVGQGPVGEGSGRLAAVCRSGGRHDEGRKRDRRRPHVGAGVAVAGEAELAAAGAGVVAARVDAEGVVGVALVLVGARFIALVDV
jgi:hypothetical protein